MDYSLSDMRVLHLRRQKESTKCMNDIRLDNGLITQCGKPKKYGFKFCYDCNMKELPKTCEIENCKKRIGEKWKYCYTHNQEKRPRSETVYDV